MSQDFILAGQPPRALPAGCRSLVVEKPRPASVWAKVGELLARHPKVDLYLGPGFSDLDCLQHLPGLRGLQVGFTGLKSWAGLGPVAGSLRRLELSVAKPGTSAAPVAACTKLERLFLVATGCRDLEQLSALRRLREADLYGWPLASLAPLGGLKLRRLTVHMGGLKTLEGMPQAERLKLVDLRALASLAPLSGQTGLRMLRLDGLRSAGPLPALAKLRQLKRVVLVGTAFTDLRPLAELPALAELAVANTSVPTLESFRPLVGHQGLRKLLVGLKSARKNQAVSELLGDLPEFNPWDEP